MKGLNDKNSTMVVFLQRAYEELNDRTERESVELPFKLQSKINRAKHNVCLNLKKKLLLKINAEELHLGENKEHDVLTKRLHVHS